MNYLIIVIALHHQNFIIILINLVKTLISIIITLTLHHNHSNLTVTTKMKK